MLASVLYIQVEPTHFGVTLLYVNQLSLRRNTISSYLQEEEGYESRNGGVGSGVSGGGGSSSVVESSGSGKRRSWDDEYVLKRQFSALIPAFDPRPGRTNVNQTTDLEIPPPGGEDISSSSSTSTEVEMAPQPRLQLILRGPNIPGVSKTKNTY